MAKNKVAQLILAVLLLSLPLFGQTSYSVYNFNNGQIDNIAWCVTNSCWQALGNNEAMAQASVGEDGSLFGVDASGNVWQYGTSSWSEMSGGEWSTIQGSTSSIHVLTASEMVALTTASAGNVYLTLNGGSTWTRMGSSTDCSDIAMDGLSNIWCVTPGGGIWLSQSGGAFTEYLPGTANAITVVATVGGRVAYVDGSGIAFQYSPTIGSFERWPLGYTVRGEVGSIGIGDDGSIALIDSSGNYDVSHDYGNSWHVADLTGITSNVTLSASSAVMAMYKGAAGRIWHLNSIMPVFEEIVNGVVLCLDLNGDCPNATEHTLTAALKFPHQFGPGSSSETQPSSDGFNVLYSDEDPACDPFDFGDGDCQPDPLPGGLCPIIGPLPIVTAVNDAVPTSGNVYYQRYVVTNVIKTTHIGNAYQWYAQVSQWCSNGYWEPWLNSILIEATTSTLPTNYWDVTLFGYAGAPAAQIGIATPSTEGANKRSDCTGYYTIPQV
jgi:hypothetical protein